MAGCAGAATGRRYCGAVAMVAVAILSVPARAGEVDDPVVVTGSRIRQADAATGAVVTIARKRLEQAGSAPVAATLAQYPGLTDTAFGPRTSGTSGMFDEAGYTTLGRAGAAFLNLRGLGEGRTLVLVDGRRHVAATAGSAAVDITSMPQALIERVDILTGGAAAVYGADGVSGVVNFRLIRNFDGLTATGQAGLSSRGDAGQRYVAVTLGRNFGGGRGNIALAYDYRDQDQVGGFARARSGDPIRTFGIVRDPADVPDDPSRPDRVPTNNLRFADSARDGAVDLNLDGVPDYTGSGKAYDRGRMLPSSGGLTQGGDGTPVAGYDGDLQAGVRTHIVNLLSHYDVGAALRLFAEAKVAHTRSITATQPSFDFLTYLAPDNAYLQDRFGGVADLSRGALLSRDNFDLGVRGERDDRATVRFVGGAEGQVSGHARYEISYVFGQTRSTTMLTNYRIADRYRAAIDAVRDPVTGVIRCRSLPDPASVGGPGSGCRPLNLLGEGVRDQAAVDWVNADLRNRTRVRQQVVSAVLSGDLGAWFTLPGGPASFAISAEYRRETSRFVPDPLLQQGAVQDFARQWPSAGGFHVRELAGEWMAPLLGDRPLAYRLSLGAAIRLSDYSTVGRTKSWRIDGRYAPVPDLTIRGSWSVAVRAPNAAELFAPRNAGYAFIADPCDPVALAEGTRYRAANCRAVLAAAGLTPAGIAAFAPQSDPVAAISLPGVSGGNRDLRAERGRTWMAGVAVEPRLLPGLTASVDWYDMRLRDAISLPTAERLAQLCVDQPSIENVYCSGIMRTRGTGYISGWTATPQNVSAFRTAGADLTLNYRSATGGAGGVTVAVAAGYLHRLAFVPSPGAVADDERHEAYHPRWTATGDLSWTIARLTVGYGLSWFSRTERYTREERAGNPDIAARAYQTYKPKWQHDLYLGLDVDGRLRIHAGATNIFDQRPAIAAPSYPTSFVGRYLYVGATIRR